jgi:hypothetical protein
MPRDEVAFVRFLAQRYHALRGLMAVAVGLAVVAAAPLLTRDWTPRDGMSLGVIVAGLVTAAIFIHRYYDDSFGRARATVKEKRHPWYAALTFAALENVGRRLSLRGMEFAILALGLAAALVFQAGKDWRFRKHAMLVPAVLAFIGINRLVDGGNPDPWVWLQRSAVLIAGAVIVQGIADHLLIAHGLSAGTRRLAASALPVATVRTPAAAVAHDPAAALMLTALTTCEEADIRFLANIAGLHPAEADARVQALRQAELIGLHDEGRGTRRVQFAKLTTAGLHVAACLWPQRSVSPPHCPLPQPPVQAPGPKPRQKSLYFKV